MARWRRLGVALALACVWAAACARPARDGAPILVLISFDGWRWDYIDRFPAPNLHALAARGVRASELIPSFPTVTFPNHYTIVTGLFPGHHGIVANTIADPSFPERFTMASATARDERWWGGEPIWVRAIRQGLRAAPTFWPGAEAPIDGVRPTYWQPFDDRLSNAGRVARALELLAMPNSQRPAFVTLYFSEVDHAGHDYGPASPELETAAAHLDAALGDFLKGVTRLGLEARTTTIVVSDHGMTAVADERRIFLDDYIGLNTVDIVEQGEFLQLAPRIGTVDDVYRRLHGAHSHLTVYKREQLPARFHYGTGPRVQPIIGVLDEGWIVTSHERQASRRPGAKPIRGGHGYDPELRAMHGLFVAAGPEIRHGLVVAPFENVHIYDLLCAILKLTPAANDGDPAVTRGLLQRP